MRPDPTPLRTVVPVLAVFGLLLTPSQPLIGAASEASDAFRALPGNVQEQAPDDGEDEGDEDKPLPLTPERSLTLDLEEGSWISVDVSPDGETLVFDHLGDLYTLPISGGEATPLTSGMAFDAQPRFSPDGERVVFTSDRDGGQNIWIMSLDGTDTVQVSEGKANRAESPEWSPDGEYVVASMGDFRGRGLPKLHLFHVDGGSGATLVDEPERLKMLGAAFGDDDRYIWYAERTGDWEYNARLPQYQLAIYDRESGERYTRTSRHGSAFRPTLSPDGRLLVYATRHDQETGLVSRDLETGEERWLAYPVQRDDQESRATMDVHPGMSFTPDSRHLVTSYGGKIWKIPVEGGEAREIPFRIQAEIPLGPEVSFDDPVEDDPTFTVRQIRDAIPSPDGSRLAFSALDRLWISDADGSDPRALTSGERSDHMPTWSPDGEWIAYVTWAGDAGHIRKIRADGAGESLRLTERGGLYTSPAWSPDGRRIVALRGYARAYRESTSPRALGAADEIVWIPADGGEATLVAPTDGRSSPHFTEDPDRIHLHGGGDGLVSIRWDGTDQRAHVKVTGSTPAGSQEPQRASLLLMAPEGDRALAVINRQIYAVTVPRVGGEAPTISVSNPDRAAFPVRKLTEIGGEFPAWGPDGETVHWSLGNAHFVYDLERARTFEDSVAAAEAEASGEEESTGEEGEAAGPEGPESGEEEEPRYRPREFRVEVTAQRDLPRGEVLLQGGQVITMEGERVLEEGDVLVRGHRIAAVAPRGKVDVPDDVRVVDVSGKTVVPGFVDVHAHMWPAWGIHRKDQWIYLANLAYGVTTTRDPQTSTTDVLTYGDLVRSGEILGPRIYSTGPGVFWQEGIEDLDHARSVLRRNSDYFDTRTIKMYVAGNRQQRQWILMAARELGLMPTTEGSLNFKQNLTETIDGYPGLEHSLPIAPVHDDVVELFVASGRTYTPTLLVAYGGPWAENWFFRTEAVHDDPKLRRFQPHEVIDGLSLRRGQWFHRDEHVFDLHARFVADLVAAGGRAAVGSHGQLQGLGFHWELWAMQSGGMGELDALRVATILGAEALGLDGDLGSVEEGKLADLVVLEDNPLDDVRATAEVRYVMKNGRLYRGDTLEEIWPREREIEPLWWWGQEPEDIPGGPGVRR